MKIPLVDPESCTFGHLYSIPISDNRTGLHHIVPINRVECDLLVYTTFKNFNNCKSLSKLGQICSN